MTTISDIEHDGTTHAVQVAFGETMIEGARDNNLPGLLADCGGACACATGHVYVDPDWVGKMAPQHSMTADMLEFAADPEPLASRLSCQITLTGNGDRLVVRIPHEQAN